MRLRLLAAVAALALLCGGGAFAVHMLKAQAASKAAEDACQTVAASVASRGPVRPLSSGPTSVLVVGDSYAAGDKIPDYKDGWAYRLGGAEHGWAVSVDAVGGSGFVNGGPCGGADFPTRLGSAASYDTVIIEGGLNDTAAEPAKLAAAVDETLALVQRVHRVIIVGPVAAPALADGARKVDALLRDRISAAEVPNVQYVSAIGWRLEYGPDDEHMTVAGHAAYLTHLVAALG